MTVRDCEASIDTHHHSTVQDCGKILELLQPCAKPWMSQIAKFMGPSWVLSAPGGPHVGPMNLVIRGNITQCVCRFQDIDKAIAVMEQLDSLAMSPLMLKKNPEIMGTIKKVGQDDQRWWTGPWFLQYISNRYKIMGTIKKVGQDDQRWWTGSWLLRYISDRYKISVLV